MVKLFISKVKELHKEATLKDSGMRKQFRTLASFKKIFAKVVCGLHFFFKNLRDICEGVH